MLASLANKGSAVSVHYCISNTQTKTEDGEWKTTPNRYLCLLFVSKVLDTCTFIHTKTETHTHIHTHPKVKRIVMIILEVSQILRENSNNEIVSAT